MPSNPQPNRTIDPHVEKRYEVERELGSGAYGIVWKAVDRKHRTVVALKKVFDAFSNQTDAQRTYREVMFLQRLRHKNIIKLLNVMRADNGIDLYLIFELMETDLHATIRGNILQDVHKQFVTYQLLRCVRHLHNVAIIHRDLKPANILLNSDCRVKLADFGLARSLATLGEEQRLRPVLTDYIATRWYRAPEIVLGSTTYTKGVDMWAVGCIIGEMLLGKPLLAGTSTMNQMERIIGALGVPTASDLRSMNSKFAETMMESLGKIKPAPLRAVLGPLSPEGADLVAQLMVFDPSKRISATEALRHPYVACFAEPDDLIDDREVEPVTVPLPDFTRYTVSEYRDALYKDIARKKRDVKMRRRAKGGEKRVGTADSDAARGGGGAPGAVATPPSSAPMPRSGAGAKQAGGGMSGNGTGADDKYYDDDAFEPE